MLLSSPFEYLKTESRPFRTNEQQVKLIHVTLHVFFILLKRVDKYSFVSSNFAEREFFAATLILVNAKANKIVDKLFFFPCHTTFFNNNPRS